MKPIVIRYGKIVLNLMVALIIAIVVIFVVPKVIVFFMPFVIGWIISLIANPLVKFLGEKLKIRRKAISGLVIVLVLVGVIFLGYAIIAKLVTELLGFMSSLPDIWKSLEVDFKNISNNLSIFVDKLPVNMQESFANVNSQITDFFSTLVGNMGTPTVAAVGSFAKNVPSFLIALIMCILSAYFFTAEKEYLTVFAKKHTSPSIQKKWNIFFSSLKYAVGGYFKAQLIIEFWIYLLLVIGFFILGVDYALLIALGIALLDFLPFFGTGAVMVPWAIVKFLSADYKMAIGLLIIWGVGQFVRQMIQPKIVGDSIGISAIPTLFLLFIGYKIAGVWGMIIAIPVGIILLNMDKSGIFDNTKMSIRLLAKGIRDFRNYTKEDIAYLEEDEKNKISFSEDEHKKSQ